MKFQYAVAGGYPSRFIFQTVERFAGCEYKQLLIGPLSVFFKIGEKKKTVYVVTVQYQGRNI